MDGAERRKYKRLGTKFDISCRKVGSTEEKSYRGRTMNVSPGGLYFETAVGVFEPGNLLELKLSVLPTAGILEFGGRISGFARVLRTDNIHVSPAGTGLSSARYGVALQFCRSPRLCM